MPFSKKVFCIGYGKTATTTLGKCLQILGSKKHCSWDECVKHNFLELWLNQEYKEIFGIIEREGYQTFDDAPWSLPYDFFKEVDTRYPKSQFILTVRPFDTWIVSLKRWYQYRVEGDRTLLDAINRKVFGVKVFQDGCEKIYVEKIKYYNNQVRKYFKNREKDFLEFNVFEGDDWNKLCNFLNVEKPEIPFPIENINMSEG